MEVYRCDLTLHDYLFFATTERGKVAETGPFIHNYALTYALGWANAPWYHEIQKPHYREELAQVGKRYVTPAQLMRGSYLVSQYNTLSEQYSLSKSRSIGYPDWGYIKCFRPGTTFRFYVVSAQDMQFPRYLRLGKFMAKAVLQTTAAQHLQQKTWSSVEQKEQQNVASPLLTWNDLPQSARPLAFDIIVNALPGHIIANPVFDGAAGSYTQATFGDSSVVRMPLHMGYYGENLCNSW